MEALNKNNLFYRGREALMKMDLPVAQQSFISSYKDDKVGKSLDYLLYTYLLESRYKDIASAIAKTNPQSGFALYTLYWFKLMTGELDELPDLLTKMLDETNYFLRIFAIKELYKTGKIENLSSLIQQKIKFFGLSYEFPIEEQRASIYLDFLYERYHLAVLQAKTLLKEYPDNGDVYLDFIEICLKAGTETTIHEVLNHESVIKMAQSDYRVMALLAKEHYKLHDLDKSKDLLLRLLMVFKNNPIFHYNLGNIYLAKKKMVKAIAEYEEAIAVAPLFERAYYNQGHAYFLLRDINKAAKCFERAVQIGKRPDAIYNLSICLIEKKELQDAYYFLNKIPSWYTPKLPPTSIKKQIKELVIFT